MKLTKQRLKEIIKEELTEKLNESNDQFMHILKMHGFKQHGRPWAGHYFFKGPHGFYATLNPKARYLDISKGDRSVHNDYAWTSLVRFFAKQGIKKIDEGKLNEEKYIVASIYGDLYTPKAVSRNVADKLMMKLAKQYAGDNVFVLGVKYWNKPHKYNKKKIMAKEGKLSESTVRINTYTDADFHSQGMALIGKKAKIGLDKRAMKSLLQIIKNKLGNSLACENTIDEASAVLNNGIKIDVGFGGVTFFAKNGQKIPLNRSELERFVKAIHKQAKINCW